MQMGVDGCGWVRWDTGGTGNTKTRQEEGGNYGHTDQDLGPMVGEISPDIMFWQGWQKVVQARADGCK